MQNWVRNLTKGTGEKVLIGKVRRNHMIENGIERKKKTQKKHGIAKKIIMKKSI